MGLLCLLVALETQLGCDAISLVQGEKNKNQFIFLKETERHLSKQRNLQGDINITASHCSVDNGN